MKKTIIIILILVGLTSVALARYYIDSSLEEISGDEVSLHPVEHITAPENNAYKIGVQNYQVALASNINTDKALQYKLDDKFISFKPVEMRWDTTKFKDIANSSATINPKNYYYEDAFGEGIDIDMNFGDRIFQKIVKINSLKDLGEIPEGAEYLEIEYEVETNMVIDGWNKYDDFEITDTVRLGDYSYLEPARAWDSYSEEVCEMVQLDNYCDEGCTLEQEANDECEYCDLPQEVCEIETNRIKVKSYLKNNNGKLIYIKQIPIDWLKNAQYPIYTDADITYGDPVTFYSSAEGCFINITEIDTDKFVVCWTRQTSQGWCAVANVSDDTITFGDDPDEFQFTTDAALTGADMGVCKLDTNKWAVSYTEDSLDDDGYTIVGTAATGTSITYGTAVEFVNSDVEYNTCASLDTDKYVMCFNNETSGDDAQCVAATVAGTNITLGDNFELNSDYPKYNDSVKIDTNQFVWCYEEEAVGGDGICVVGTTATSTSVVFGTENEFTSDNAICHGVSSPDTDVFVNAYAKTGVYGAIVGTVAGDTITYGAEDSFDAGATYPRNNTAVGIDSTHIVIAYEDQDNASKGTATYVTVDSVNRSISNDTQDVFEDGSTGGGTADFGLDIDLISSNKVVICFQDDDDADKGKCIIGETPSAEPPVSAGKHPPEIIIFD